MFILEALRGGADGVLVTGCHLGDCHYLSGNEKAILNVEMAHSLIQLLGIEPERLRLEWISAAEGTRFAELVRDFTDQIRQLGPNPLQTAANGRRDRSPRRDGSLPLEQGATVS
jgi:F420-non-reducing hydrogenase iron-sulfur subunit